ncbi:hypothetical protein ES332_D11G200000v1 [Gossypium tomentosum]|uniref:Uncharacterized protein n=1 Tax=Gossypium tomentosum TaxID=34277 RepID=A0A5D2IPU6_GOSTO|nr:hypothetical protein ES332_D11G200000v1 [Gossypium tomentosum]
MPVVWLQKEESGKGAEPMPMKKIKRDKSLIYTPHPAHLWRSHSQHDVVDQSKGRLVGALEFKFNLCPIILSIYIPMGQ